MSYTQSDHATELMADLASVDVNSMDPDEMESTLRTYIELAKDGVHSYDDNGYRKD